MKQARYISVASVIDIICVSCGLNPGVGCGRVPEDFGFARPEDLPDFAALIGPNGGNK